MEKKSAMAAHNGSPMYHPCLRNCHVEFPFVALHVAGHYRRDFVFVLMMVVALGEIAFQEMHFPLSGLVMIDGKFKTMAEAETYRQGSSTRTTPRSWLGFHLRKEVTICTFALSVVTVFIGSSCFKVTKDRASASSASGWQDYGGWHQGWDGRWHDNWHHKHESQWGQAACQLWFVLFAFSGRMCVCALTCHGRPA